LNSKLQGDISFAMVREAVEKYIDFEGQSPMVAPLLGVPRPTAGHVILELGQDLPACSNL